jgi:GNAT superfamily N-acetyltransferase
MVRSATADEVVGVRHEVLRPGRPRATAVFDGDDAPSTRHWVAVQAPDDPDARRVVGVVSVMEAPLPDASNGTPRWQLRGMAVLPGLRGEGVGTQLLEAVHRDVAEPLWCNARESAEGFYLRHGWAPHGDLIDVKGIGPHRRMSWTP